MSSHKKLFLLDAMALIYRAYFALSRNPRINSKGMNTSAILGFGNTLLEVIRKEQPTHLGVAFDTMAPTHRHEEFTEYKAHREAIPEDLAISLPHIRRLIEGFRIPLLEMEGYEADDVIGTLSRKAENVGFTTYMMTPDKDFGQLVTDKTFIYKPPRMGNKPEILGIREVCEKYGIREPSQVTDILGLWGDASDNIPGIPGIGEKRARELISEFGSLEALVENTGRLTGKIRETIEQHARQGLFSKQLATIRTDVPVEFREEDFLLRDPDPEILTGLFSELEFRSFAKRVFPDLSVESAMQPDVSVTPQVTAPSEPYNIHTTQHNYHLVSSEEELSGLLQLLVSSERFCFDTETTGIDPHTSELVGIAFSVMPHEAFYLALPSNYNESLMILSKFRELFANPDIVKVGQNLKFDIAVLKWYEIEVSGPLFDTMLAHYLLQPDMRHNMDLLAETYLNYKPVPIGELIGKKGRGQLSMRSVEIEMVKEYACEDADITLQLQEVFEKELTGHNLQKLFHEVETPLVPVLASMEAEGVRLDVPVLRNYSEQLKTEIRELEGEIFRECGETFNIGSPKQLGEILFEKLRIDEKPKKTKTSQYSTSEEVLQKLVYRHPVIRMILDYRSLTKLRSTYVDVLPDMVNPRTGRIHTSYNQAVAATGRLSSNNPNLQNIPIRTERGREIRKAFVPRNEQYLLLSADYSQIELRIMAELSGDKGMQAAFAESHDIHAATASRVYGVPMELVTQEMRRKAKTVNFGIIYGISAFGLSERLNIPRKEARGIIDQYFSQYPGIREYMERTIEKARRQGYVETILGRRRYLRDINSSNSVVRGFAERNAINAPIQGSAADMIKIAMIRIQHALQEKQLRSRMILQVHDELVFDVHREELQVTEFLVREHMVHALPMKVPVEVEINTGENWLEAH
ncbi:MAG: DNA polymerase I [Bacteroidales bacterium]|nr:DNA polymerase I [Bacteroidales bacterium]